MFEADLHAHSQFSSCGLHSIIEMLTMAKKKGLKAQAITDHGPFLGRKPSSTFFERLNNPVEGIQLLKGMECNIINETGEIDIIDKFMQWYDVILVGFHYFEKKNASPSYYSKIMTKAITVNPCMDIIVHPNAPGYLMDFKAIAESAAEHGVAVELNNAKLRLGRSSEEETVNLINACKNAGCEVAVNTDAHALNEVGCHTMIENLLEKTDFPEDKIVNRTLASTTDWIKIRKERRRLNY